MNVEEYGFEPQNHHPTLFLQLVVSGYCYYVFLFFLFEIIICFRIFYFFYFTRTMKIITGRCRLVLTEESPTTLDDNNKLAVFAVYYTRCLFPLSAFLNDCSRYPPKSHQLKRNQDMCIRILSGMLRMRFAVLQYFFSLHKNFPTVTSLFPTAN